MKTATILGLVSLCFATISWVLFLMFWNMGWWFYPYETFKHTSAILLFFALGATYVLGCLALFLLKKNKLFTPVLIGMLSLIVPFWVASKRIPLSTDRIYAPAEAGPISALRTISSAQELYYSRFNSYATLAQLGNVRMIDAILASATTPASQKNGAYYTVTVGGSDWWCCVARPFIWGETGERNFRTDQTGVIYYNTEENSSEFTKKLGE